MLMVDRAEHRPLESFTQTIMRNTVQRVAPEWITTPIQVLARAMCFNTLTKNSSGIEILDNHAIFRLAEEQPLANKEKSSIHNALYSISFCSRVQFSLEFFAAYNVCRIDRNKASGAV